MTIASMFLALALTTAADTPGAEPVLYDFHASWCGPCREMRPEVDRLARRNYPIRSIDIDQARDLADRFQVKAVPTFIVVDPQGKVLARTSGKMPATDLAAFYNDATTRYQAQSQREVGDRTEADDTDRETVEAAPTPAPRRANPLPWQTVVRIKMHLSPESMGLGSGTIIYSDDDESIILTCAHIFKGVHGQETPLRQFRTRITIDLFNGVINDYKNPQLKCVQQGIAGEAIDYDFGNDVGLIRIRPGRKLPASRVVPASWKPERGTPMYSVGCSHGEDATARDTRILDPSVKMLSGKTSFYEMKCSTQPEEGRSGGGLYTKDGFVAGVCDFADPREKVGLYAVPTAIHRLLDKNQLTALYKSPTDGANRMLAAANRNRTKVRAQSDDEASPTEAAGFTIPRPDQLNIKQPGTKVASATTRPSSWGNSNFEDGGRSSRTARRPERDAGPSVDPGPKGGEAVPTDTATTPSSEDLVLGMPQPQPDDLKALPEPTTSNTRWRGVHSTRPSPRD